MRTALGASPAILGPQPRVTAARCHRAERSGVPWVAPSAAYLMGALFALNAANLSPLWRRRRSLATWPGHHPTSPRTIRIRPPSGRSARPLRARGFAGYCLDCALSRTGERTLGAAPACRNEPTRPRCRRVRVATRSLGARDPCPHGLATTPPYHEVVRGAAMRR